MGLYARLAQTVARQLAEKGQPGVLMRAQPAVYDIPTSSNIAAADVAGPVRIAVFGYGAHLVDGTRIKSTDKRVLCAVAAPFPTTEDTLLIDGVSHEIVDVTTIAPAGVAVMFTLQCRA